MHTKYCSKLGMKETQFIELIHLYKLALLLKKHQQSQMTENDSSVMVYTGCYTDLMPKLMK